MTLRAWYPEAHPPSRAREGLRPWWSREIGRLMARRVKWAVEEGGQVFLSDDPAGSGYRLTLFCGGRRETYYLNEGETKALRKECPLL